MKLQHQIYIEEYQYKSAAICVIASNYINSELCFLMHIGVFYLVNDLFTKKWFGSELFINLMNNSE